MTISELLKSQQFIFKINCLATQFTIFPVDSMNNLLAHHLADNDIIFGLNYQQFWEQTHSLKSQPKQKPQPEATYHPRILQNNIIQTHHQF